MPKQVYHGQAGEPMDEFQQDLQKQRPITDANVKYAHEYKEIHRLHPGISNEELKRIPVIPEGTELTQGAKYFDLLHPEQGEIDASPGMRANDFNLYVAKTDVDYPLWNRMIGVTDAARLDQAVDATQTQPS
jgi:hypothetical protein